MTFVDRIRENWGREASEALLGKDLGNVRQMCAIAPNGTPLSGGGRQNGKNIV